MRCWLFVISVQVINEYMYKFIQLERKIQILNSLFIDFFDLIYVYNFIIMQLGVIRYIIQIDMNWNY